jgi:hypothetical protein
MASSLPQVQYDLIRLSGGLDQVTPTLSLSPGVMRRSANFECSITGGYTRIAGYERFDGRPAPSAALYSVLTCALTGTVAVGNTVTGYTSSATGEVIAVSGGDVVITRQTGTFLESEGLLVGASSVGTINAISNLVADGLLDATYKSLAADNYRSDIQAVPGSGHVRGVVYYKGNVYAWRNNASDTALAMYKSSASGWTAITLGIELAFDGGTQEIVDGTTVVGHISGATGIARRVIVSGGSWHGAPHASGRIIFTSVTGTFLNNEHIDVGGTKYALVDGTQSQMTWLPSGRVQAVIANFGGGQDNQKLYFCDGKNRAFEFDGTYLVPVATAMSPDTPTCIAAHKQHLFLAFGHSLQFSSIGNPYVWDPVLGAGEIAMNDDITNLPQLPGDQSSGALGIYTENETSILYGSSEADFKLSNFNNASGAMRYTAQNLDQTYALSQRGVMGMSTTLNFGNFLSNSMTMNIRPFIQARRHLATASVLNREKGQYRLFFSDGTGLYMTVANGKLIGSGPVQFPNPAMCCSDGSNADGAETSYFGSTNGFVYTLDAGTSFDGSNISANITLVYNSINSPRILKRYRRASVEMTGDSYAEFSFAYDLGYRTPELEQPADQIYGNDLRASYWDSFTWDNFAWDGRDISPSEVEVTGTAENIAIRISSVSKLFKPFTVNTIIVHYSMRRGLR